MNKFVLDANVALRWTLPEPHSDKALALRDDARNQIIELLAPDIFPVEIAHSLTRAERQGRIPFGQSKDRLQDILDLGPDLRPYLPFLHRATAISSTLRVGVYDCLYVALAEAEQCDFVTADDKLIKNLQGHFPFIVSLSTLP